MPICRLALRRGGKLKRAESNEPEIAAPARDETLVEGPGTVIGNYKLLQQIGEGGTGVVYSTEQTVSFDKRVALKIIKLGMDTKAVVRRFEAERKVPALINHPNIAKVLAAGADVRPVYPAYQLN